MAVLRYKLFMLKEMVVCFGTIVLLLLMIPQYKIWKIGK